MNQEYYVIPTKLKGKFYKTAIRLAMLYGSECQAVKKQHIQKMNIIEMTMFRQMSDNTQKGQIKKIYAGQVRGSTNRR